MLSFLNVRCIYVKLYYMIDILKSPPSSQKFESLYFIILCIWHLYYQELANCSKNHQDAQILSISIIKCLLTWGAVSKVPSEVEELVEISPNEEPNPFQYPVFLCLHPVRLSSLPHKVSISFLLNSFIWQIFLKLSPKLTFLCFCLLNLALLSTEKQK